MKTVLAALVALVPASAMAGPITFTGSGTFDRGSFSESVGSNVTRIANPYNAPGADNFFSFSLSFDTSAPDQDSGDPESGFFDGAVTGFTVTNGVCSVDVAGGDVQVSTSSNFATFSGGIRQASDQGCVVDGLDFSAALLEFQFDPDTLQSDALDPFGWPLDEAEITFSLNFFRFLGFPGPRAQGGFVSGGVNDLNIITALPEPASLALFGLGLAGLSFAVRRRKRSSGARCR